MRVAPEDSLLSSRFWVGTRSDNYNFYRTSKPPYPLSFSFQTPALSRKTVPVRAFLRSKSHAAWRFEELNLRQICLPLRSHRTTQTSRKAARNYTTLHSISRRPFRHDRRIEFCVYIMPASLKLVMLWACLKFLERSDSRKRLFLLRIVTLTNSAY